MDCQPPEFAFKRSVSFRRVAKHESPGAGFPGNSDVREGPGGPTVPIDRHAMRLGDDGDEHQPLRKEDVINIQLDRAC